MEILRKNIESGKIEEVISLISTLNQEVKIQNELILISARYNDIMKQIRVGIIKFEDSQNEINKIRYSLLELVNEIEKNDLKNPLSTEISNNIKDVQNEKLSISNSISQTFYKKALELEGYLTHGLVKQLNEAETKGSIAVDLDSRPLKQFYLYIREISYFLNNDLENELVSFNQYYFIDTFNNYIKLVNQVINKEKTYDELNAYIPNRLSQDYKIRLHQLKELIITTERENYS